MRTLAETGGNWRKLAETGGAAMRTLAETGGNWRVLAGAGGVEQDIYFPEVLWFLFLRAGGLVLKLRAAEGPARLRRGRGRALCHQGFVNTREVLSCGKLTNVRHHQRTPRLNGSTSRDMPQLGELFLPRLQPTRRNTSFGFM